MRKLVGIVQTENPEDAGTVLFSLVLPEGNLVACRSGAGFKSPRPRRGDCVAIIGDNIADLVTQGESPEFFYSSLEILTSAPSPVLA